MITNQDSLEYLKTMPDNSVDAIITDPPYGILKGHKIETNIDIALFLKEAYRVLKKDCFLIFFGMQPTLTNWNYEAMKLFKYKHEVIWYKRSASNFFNVMLNVHENIMFFVKGKRTINDVRTKYSDIIESLADVYNSEFMVKMIGFTEMMLRTEENYKNIVSKVKAYTRKSTSNDKRFSHANLPHHWGVGYNMLKNGCHPRTVVSFKPHNLIGTDMTGQGGGEHNVKHPTVKPTLLMEYILKLTTNEGDLVLDPFMGSGTTGIACFTTGREFLGIEIDTGYFEIAKKRIENSVRQLEVEL